MTIEIFRVGGCVRDLLLRKEGLDIPEGDRDWVVTGATPEDMVSKGYLPVGADFPVFLHPETHEEYALARTERKTAAGYHGFQFYAAPDVTLTDDLRRRDLTINAMAQSADGTLIDPYGGQKDLKARLLRHISSAFAEDPVRILRIARFAAKLPGFTVAPETMVLLRKMVACGEADALVAERVWAEFKKGLMSADPAAMIAVLKACGYWERAFPEVPASGNEIRALTRAAKAGFPLTVRAVLLFETAGEDESAVRRRFKALRAPADVTELALLDNRLRDAVTTASTPEAMADVLEKSDVLRRPARFEALLEAAEARHPDFNPEKLRKAAALWCAVDAGSVAREAVSEGKPAEIAARVAAARRKALMQP